MTQHQRSEYIQPIQDHAAKNQRTVDFLSLWFTPVDRNDNLRLSTSGHLLFGEVFTCYHHDFNPLVLTGSMIKLLSYISCPYFLFHTHHWTDGKNRCYAISLYGMEESSWLSLYGNDLERFCESLKPAIDKE